MSDRGQNSLAVRWSKLKHAMLFRVRKLLDWRTSADAAKRNGLVLRLADRMGRGTGRLRFLDHLRPMRRNTTLTLDAYLEGDLGAIWVGHATMLLRVGGKTILTDPVFHPRVGLGYGIGTLGPRRFQAPAITIEQLPPLDLILVSHGHFDHLDRPSLRKIARRFGDVPVRSADGVGDLLDDLKFSDVREMKWGETAEVAGIRLTSLEVKHWGPRVFFDDWRSFCAFKLEAGSHRVIFGADTAETDLFQGLGPVDLMCVGIGAYDPYVAAHATPEQAWQMTRDAEARHVAAMHHSTFRLSHEPMDEPLKRLLTVAGDEASRIVIRNVGDVWTA